MANLWLYLLKRILQAIPTLFGVLTLTFILGRLMPGDPVLALLPQQFSREQYWEQYVALGFNRPIWVQYWDYLTDIFTGDWGVSISVNKGEPVWDLILSRFPRTFDLALFSVFFASLIGIKAGVISSTNRNQPKDTAFRGIALVGVSIPIFWLGMMLQYAFSYKLGLLPGIGFKTAGFDDPTAITNFRIIDSLLTGRFDIMFDYILHLILPVFCLTFVTLASITRQSRSSMLEVLEQDYIRTARAKGCKEEDVINSHALRNALIPTVTVIGLNFAGLLGGAVLTETTFNLHGIGEILTSAIVAADYWTLNAVVFVVALLFIGINLLTDLIYGFLDPRIRY